jgi:hypothetical protein
VEKPLRIRHHRSAENWPTTDMAAVGRWDIGLYLSPPTPKSNAFWFALDNNAPAQSANLFAAPQLEFLYRNPRKSSKLYSPWLRQKKVKWSYEPPPQPGCIRVRN